MIINNLSKIMGMKRIKITELNRKTGISRTALTKIYYDKTKMISLETLDKLCKELKVTPGEIFEFEGEH